MGSEIGTDVHVAFLNICNIDVITRIVDSRRQWTPTIKIEKHSVLIDNTTTFEKVGENIVNKLGLNKETLDLWLNDLEEMFQVMDWDKNTLTFWGFSRHRRTPIVNLVKFPEIIFVKKILHTKFYPKKISL